MFVFHACPVYVPCPFFFQLPLQNCYNESLNLNFISVYIDLARNIQTLIYNLTRVITLDDIYFQFTIPFYILYPRKGIEISKIL